MKKGLIVIFILCLAYSSNAQQDRHYSMFYASPMTLNPGATGAFDGDYQFFAGYKNQWSSINPNLFKTISASIDAKLFQDKLNNGFFGAGINFYNDLAGDSKLTTNVVNISLSYALEIAKDHKLAIGVQPTFLQRHIKNTDLIWDNQWTGSDFNQSISNNELLTSNASFRFDLSSGIYYFGKVNDEISLNAGVSGAHILKPSKILLNTVEKLYRKITIHGGGEIKFNQNKMSISPNFFMFMQGPNSEYTFGLDYKYVLKESSLYTGYNNETSLSLGAYHRLKDAIYPTFFVNYSSFSLGVSYDINISGLNIATGGMGGMEMLLRYRVNLNGTSAARFL